MRIKYCLHQICTFIASGGFLHELFNHKKNADSYIDEKTIIIFFSNCTFDANCMEIGFLLLKILRFYVFKVAANEGRNFEINI